MVVEESKPPRASPLTRLLQLIRFSHTIFALPFALGALLVAANGHPTLRTSLLVLACMVLARTAAVLASGGRDVLCSWSRADLRAPGFRVRSPRADAFAGRPGRRRAQFAARPGAPPFHVPGAGRLR